MKIFIDFDGVLLDTNNLVIKEVLNEIHDDGLNEIFEEIDWDKIYKEASIINDGINILRDIQDKYDITILTKIKHLNEGAAKIKYLKQQGINVPIVLVPISVSKTNVVNLTENDLLIDDDIKNINEWKKCGGKAYRFNKQDRLNHIESYFK